MVPGALPRRPASGDRQEEVEEHIRVDCDKGFGQKDGREEIFGMVVQVPDDKLRTVRPASDCRAFGDKSPFQPLLVCGEIPAAFEFDAVQVSGETFELIHQGFSSSTSSHFRSHAKVRDSRHAMRHAIEEIAMYFIPVIRGDKVRAFGDAFFKRPARHEANSARILAIEGENAIAPILLGQMADGERYAREIPMEIPSACTFPDRLPEIADLEYLPTIRPVINGIEMPGGEHTLARTLRFSGAPIQPSSSHHASQILQNERCRQRLHHR